MSSLELACPCLNIRLRLEQRKTHGEPDLRNADAGPYLQQKSTIRLLQQLTGGQSSMVAHLQRDPFFAGLGTAAYVVEGAQIVPTFQLKQLAQTRFLPTAPSPTNTTTGTGNGTTTTGIGSVGSGWRVTRCLVCDTDLFATSAHQSPPEQQTLTVVSGDVLAGIEIANAKAKAVACDQFLPAYQLILSREHMDSNTTTDDCTQEGCSILPEESMGMKQKSLTDTAASLQIDVGHHSPSASPTSAATINSTAGLDLVESEMAQEIVANCANFLRAQKAAMDERIRNFAKSEADRFEELRKQAKNDRDKLLGELRKKALVAGGDLSPKLSELGSLSNGVNGYRNSDDTDSAVPLSPVSQTSAGDPSPQLGAANADVPPVFPPVSPLRPKAHSNPVGNGWPIRGAAAAAIAAGAPKPETWTAGASTESWRTSYQQADPDAAENLFSFDEEVAAKNCGSADGDTPSFLADDEAETDDSGTGDQDYYRYYKMQSAVGQPDVPAVISGPDAVPPLPKVPQRTAGAGRLALYGKSMPVTVPTLEHWQKDGGMEPAFCAPGSSSEEEELDQFLNHRAVQSKRRSTGGLPGRGPQDVRASIQALARSIQAADDPERLFGERPQRRRYKTGELVRNQIRAGDKITA